MNDSLNGVLLSSLLIGSLLGVGLSSQVSHCLPEPLIRAPLASVLLVVGGRLVY